MITLKREVPRVWLGILLSLCPFVAAGQGKAPEDAALSIEVPRFELTNQTIFDGVAKLSLERMPLALGFEGVLKAKFADPPIPDPHFTLQLENKTVREVLDTLCSLDTRYTWSRDELTINVYPSATMGDSSYLLNRHLDKLVIKDAPDPDHALLPIMQQLPPPKEQFGYGGIGGDPSYKEPWTVTFENLTVRQAINRLASHMGPRSSWVFSGSQEFRMFGFFKFGFNPESQEPPRHPADLPHFSAHGGWPWLCFEGVPHPCASPGAPFFAKQRAGGSAF
jgi:hypothetical protein